MGLKSHWQKQYATDFLLDIRGDQYLHCLHTPYSEYNFEIKCRAATYMSFLIIRNIVSSHPLILCIFFINKHCSFKSRLSDWQRNGGNPNLMMIHKHLGSFRKSYFIKRRINLTPKAVPQASFNALMS